MDELAKRALAYLREIKSVTFATVEQGVPSARIIDVMMVDDEGLYFLTGRGKPFYREIIEGEVVAVTAMTPEWVSVRVVGDVRPNSDPKVREKIFIDNPVLSQLYPGGKDDILEVFQLYRGRGELFDLSGGLPERERFAFGGEEPSVPGAFITKACTACGACEPECPVGAISKGEIYVVDGSRCLECGRCAEYCTFDAIEPAKGL
ncbi:MAG: (4Fe-4S)-binding protein [Deltaproteobacteria bacterium]|nr:MAG: (4Fe-4S)-binding protein [Deltaproteobacteria bacterium]